MERGRNMQGLMNVLDQQVEAAQLLLGVLREERAALTGSDPDALTSIVRSKDAARSQLELLEQERRRLSMALGLGVDRRDFEAACGDRSPAALATQPKWQALAGLLAQCRDLNQTNGMTVSALRRRVLQASSLLRGESMPAAIYGPGGSTQPGGRPARAFGRA